MADLSFDLAELAATAGVTVRTIRYYIQLGLLPAPEIRGPITRYTTGHLDRLRLIRQLQREHLPLAQIRRQLEDLNDAAVDRALKAAAGRKTPKTAATYVRDVLARSSVQQLPPRGATSPVLPAVLNEPAVTGPKELRSTWDRISLSPDFELHVRRPLSREQNRQLERLLDAAREVLLVDE